MRFDDLTFREIRDRADAGWLAIVPTDTSASWVAGPRYAY